MNKVSLTFQYLILSVKRNICWSSLHLALFSESRRPTLQIYPSSICYTRSKYHGIPVLNFNQFREESTTSQPAAHCKPHEIKNKGVFIECKKVQYLQVYFSSPIPLSKIYRYSSKFCIKVLSYKKKVTNFDENCHIFAIHEQIFIFNERANLKWADICQKDSSIVKGTFAQECLRKKTSWKAKPLG